jgi:hypothetical protein
MIGTTVVAQRLFTMDCNGGFLAWYTDQMEEPVLPTGWVSQPSDSTKWAKMECSFNGLKRHAGYLEFPVKRYCTLAVEKNHYIYIPKGYAEPDGTGTPYQEPKNRITAIDLKKIKIDKKKRVVNKLIFMWETQVANATTPVFYNDKIYTGNGPVTAIDAKSGRILWQTDLPISYETTKYRKSRTNLSTPAVSGDWVLISAQPDETDGFLYVLNARSGKIIEQHKISGASQDVDHNIFHSSPAVVGGWVYVGSTDGCLYAFQGKE